MNKDISDATRQALEHLLLKLKENKIKVLGVDENSPYIDLYLVSPPGGDAGPDIYLLADHMGIRAVSGAWITGSTDKVIKQFKFVNFK